MNIFTEQKCFAEAEIQIHKNWHDFPKYTKEYRHRDDPTTACAILFFWLLLLIQSNIFLRSKTTIMANNFLIAQGYLNGLIFSKWRLHHLFCSFITNREGT